MEYRGYTIGPKRDFGGKPFSIEGRSVMSGFVVGKDHVGNIMPGATWFETIEQAKHGIDCHIAANGSSDEFWRLVRVGYPAHIV
jgi:hypothetical protein